MFYFNFPEHVVELHLGETTIKTKTKKLNWCSRNIKYCISVDMYRKITRLNISKQMQTLTRGTSLSSSVPAQLIFLEYKCCTSKVWFAQRRTHNYSLHTYGKYAFFFPHIIAFDSYFHPIMWGTDVTLTAKARTTGGDVSCPMGDPGGEAGQQSGPLFLYYPPCRSPTVLLRVSESQERYNNATSHQSWGRRRTDGRGREGLRQGPGRGAVVTKTMVGSSQRLDYSFH